MSGQLPDELLLFIFSLLSDCRDAFSVLAVCRQWRAVGLDRSLWHDRFVPLRRAVVLASASTPAGGLRLNVEVATSDESDRPVAEASARGFNLDSLREVVGFVSFARVNRATLRGVLQRLAGGVVRGLSFEHCALDAELVDTDVAALVGLRALALNDCAVSQELAAALFRVPVALESMTLFVYHELTLQADWVTASSRLRTFCCNVWVSVGEQFFAATRFPSLAHLEFHGFKTEQQLFGGAASPYLLNFSVTLDFAHPCLQQRYPSLTTLTLNDWRLDTAHQDTAPFAPEQAPVLRRLVYRTNAGVSLGWCIGFMREHATLREIVITGITREGVLHDATVFRSHTAVPDGVKSERTVILSTPHPLPEGSKKPSPRLSLRIRNCGLDDGGRPVASYLLLRGDPMEAPRLIL